MVRNIIIVVIVVILILFIAFAFWLPSFVMTGKRQTLEEALAWQSDHYDTSFYEGLEKTDYIVKGYEDYDLHVELLKNPSPTDKYIIVSHGYTDNRMGALKYVQMYMDLGFNCIIYDLRGHGENATDFTTYGVREAQDLKCIVDDTRKRYDDISVLGLHGESLGAATTITSLKYKPEIDFAVADCGFSDIDNVLREGYRNAHAPVFLVDLADFTGKIIKCRSCLFMARMTHLFSLRIRRIWQQERQAIARYISFRRQDMQNQFLRHRMTIRIMLRGF